MARVEGTLGNGENAVTVQGGQTATVILRPKDETGASGGSGDSGNTEKDMEQKVYVEKLTETNVPIFAITEILSDPVLQRKIEATTELKIKKLEEVLEELKNILGIQNKEALNNPNIINELIIDICNNSTIEKGICFSTEKLNLINKIKEFNYNNIYSHPRLDASNEYFKIIINNQNKNKFGQVG